MNMDILVVLPNEKTVTVAFNTESTGHMRNGRVYGYSDHSVVIAGEDCTYVLKGEAYDKVVLRFAEAVVGSQNSPLKPLLDLRDLNMM